MIRPVLDAFVLLSGRGRLMFVSAEVFTLQVTYVFITSIRSDWATTFDCFLHDRFEYIDVCKDLCPVVRLHLEFWAKVETTSLTCC